MSLLTSATTIIPGRAAMRVVLLRWFVDALQPAPREQRPEEHRSRNDEHAETPASVRGVRVNLRDAHQHEWDGEHQSAQQVNPCSDEQCFGNHGVATFSARGISCANSEL